jgi:hypothetical protein
MTKGRLLPCPGCARHARASETTCPFCGSPLAEAFAEAPLPRKPSARLTRAALYAIGATSLGVAAACGTSSGGATDAGSDHMFTAAYGAPCMGVDGGPCGPADTGAEAGSEAGVDGPVEELIAIYGGPPDGFGGEVVPETGPSDGHSG